MAINYQNLQNQKFGKLIAKELIDDYDSNGTTKKWKCQCECGNFINVSARILNYSKNNNKNISCGCAKIKDYIGNVFGDYLVIKYCQDKTNNKHKFYYCKCIKCGKETILDTLQLYKNKKCQECLKKESKIKNALKSKLNHIKRRCYDKRCPDYVNYGLRGIRVCEEWLGNSDTFVEWSLKNGYEPGLTIDRIDNNGNYEPNNCRYVNRYIQNNNKRNNLIIEYNNKKQNLKQWCIELGLPYRQTHSRIYTYNFSIEKAFSKKYRKNKE